jgi:TonB family protein
MNRSSMSRVLAVVAVAVAVTLGPVSVATGQTANEADLRARIDQQPGSVGAYLDLAKVYAEQQRYVEAMRLLQTAMTLLQREQAAMFGGVQPSAGVSGGLEIPNGTVRVGGAILEPKKLRHVAPVYPAIAQSAFVQGVVILEVLIDPTGNVADTRVMRSVPLLDQAATDAVRQWQFTPTLFNGVPTPVLMTVTVNFSLR